MIKASKKAQDGVTAFITDLENDDQVQLYDCSVLQFEREMTEAPADADLDVICKKYFDEQKGYDALDFANADMEYSNDFDI